MVRKSAFEAVLMEFEPVIRRLPSGEQTAFIRKIHTVARSPRLLKFRECIREKFTGRRFPKDRLGVREAFAKVAEECKEELMSDMKEVGEIL